MGEMVDATTMNIFFTPGSSSAPLQQQQSETTNAQGKMKVVYAGIVGLITTFL
jgi:hypothetical protein